MNTKQVPLEERLIRHTCLIDHGSDDNSPKWPALPCPEGFAQRRSPRPGGGAKEKFPTVEEGEITRSFKRSRRRVLYTKAIPWPLVR